MVSKLLRLPFFYVSASFLGFSLPETAKLRAPHRFKISSAEGRRPHEVRKKTMFHVCFTSKHKDVLWWFIVIYGDDYGDYYGDLLFRYGDF